MPLGLGQETKILQIEAETYLAEDYDANAKGFLSQTIPEEETTDETEVDPSEPSTDPDAADETDTTDPTDPADDAEDDASDEDETSETNPEAEVNPEASEIVDIVKPIYWNVDMSMSQMISPSHMSIVLSRVNTENINFKPGLEIQAYILLEEKDDFTGAYRAITSK